MKRGTLIPEKLTVVLPSYNEALHIGKVLDRICKELVGIDYKLIVVDDGSTDNSVEVLKSLSIPNLEIISYKSNQGKGYALQTGLSKIRTEYGAYIDADLDIDPSALVTGIYELRKDSNLSIAIGSKVHKESIVEYPAIRRILSRIYRILTTILFRLNVNDTQTGIKVFRTSDIQYALSKVSANGWSFDLEFLSYIQRGGGKILEIPVKLDYQFNSNLDGKSAISSLWETFKFARSFRKHNRVHSSH